MAGKSMSPTLRASSPPKVISDAGKENAPYPTNSPNSSSPTGIAHGGGVKGSSSPSTTTGVTGYPTSSPPAKSKSNGPSSSTGLSSSNSCGTPATSPSLTAGGRQATPPPAAGDTPRAVDAGPEGGGGPPAVSSHGTGGRGSMVEMGGKEAGDAMVEEDASHRPETIGGNSGRAVMIVTSGSSSSDASSNGGMMVAATPAAVLGVTAKLSTRAADNAKSGGLSLKGALLLPTPRQEMPPSACTTPSVSPTAKLGREMFMSPPASPWPPLSGGASGGSDRTPINRYSGSKNRDSWKSGKGGEIAGNGLFMSPISVKACSPRAMMSPPPTMPSPRVTVGDLLGPQRDLFSIGVGSADSAEWWGELELSPPRADTPGLQKWRESRKPPSSLPHPEGGLSRTRSSATTSTGRSDSPEGYPACLSPTRSSLMTRSRATSLAVKRGELRDGEEEHARGNGVAGAWADEALDSMRQLEAENLRLRFQVADLEGQVVKMEDELDRRGALSTENDSESCASPQGDADDASDFFEEEGNAGQGADGNGPLSSPRSRGYLARLVLKVCAELEEEKKASRKPCSKAKSTHDGKTDENVPRSERLCKVLPRVMETAIRGVKDLDEQVFEQMMQTASEKMPAPAPVAPPGTPARRLSTCVVARDGGGDFFAQSPAPGRPASFFRLGQEAKSARDYSLRRTSSAAGTSRSSLSRAIGGFGSNSTERTRPVSAKVSTPEASLARGGKQLDPRQENKAERPLGERFLGAGEWIANAFTPRGADESLEPARSFRTKARAEQEDNPGPLVPPHAPENQRALSFEGSTEEVLRYTIVAKSYLIRSRSKKHGEGAPSPAKTLLSPGGTARTVAEGDEDDVRDATKELLNLKTRYMASTQHWLKTDIVNDEELRTIRAQVFEAIQRKRSELHREAAAVLRADSSPKQKDEEDGGEDCNSDGESEAPRVTGGTGGDADGSTPPRKKPAGVPSKPAPAGGKDTILSGGPQEDEANRTITMLAGTAELLKFSRLLLLLSEAISVSASVAASKIRNARADSASAIQNHPARKKRLQVRMGRADSLGTPSAGAMDNLVASAGSSVPERIAAKGSPRSSISGAKGFELTTPLRPSMRRMEASPE